MAHPRARLTPLGRRLLVDRVLEMGRSPAAAAEAAGVSRATCYKWVKRYEAEGIEASLVYLFWRNAVAGNVLLSTLIPE